MALLGNSVVLFRSARLALRESAALSSDLLDLVGMIRSISLSANPCVRTTSNSDYSDSLIISGTVLKSTCCNKSCVC